jgi:phosphatidylinositol glycan class P protein
MTAGSNIQRATAGFVAWVLTFGGIVMYFVWSSLTEDALHAVGLTYYPNRYWAVALPAFAIATALYYTATYWLLYVRNTKALPDLYCLTDPTAREAAPSYCPLTEASPSVPPLSDIPVAVSSRLLYHTWAEDDSAAPFATS